MSAPGDAGRVIAEVQAMSEQAVGAVNVIVSGVDAVIGLVPDPAGLLAGVRGMIADLDRFLAQVGEFLSYGGSPDALRSAGEAWTLQVGARASALAPLATADVALADDRWQGVAAQAYRNSLIRQNAALVAVKNTTDDLQTVLNDMATAILDFWLSIAAVMAGLVATALASAALAATAIGLPVAIVSMTAAVSLALGGATQALSALQTINGTAAASAVALQQRLADGSTFPAGRWPRSTTGFFDASLRDGDGLEWELQW